MKIIIDSEADKKLMEIEILKKLNSQFIIKFIKVFVEMPRLYFLTEFCENGDLAAKIQATKDSNIKIKDELILKWTKQIIKVIDYLHNSIQPKCIHRDIKPGYVYSVLFVYS